jgi:hypothetical protein
MKRTKWFLAPAMALSLVLVAAGSALAAGAGGVTGPAIYVDGVTYRTVGTPTADAFPKTGAPEHSYDTIYDFGGLQNSVATAAPGDPGFNGGRWMVHALSFTDYGAAVAAYDTNGSGDLDSDEEVMAAINGGIGGATDLGVVKMFECPLIKVAPGGA